MRIWKLKCNFELFCQQSNLQLRSCEGGASHCLQRHCLWLFANSIHKVDKGMISCSEWFYSAAVDLNKRCNHPTKVKASRGCLHLFLCGICCRVSLLLSWSMEHGQTVLVLYQTDFTCCLIAQRLLWDFMPQSWAIGRQLEIFLTGNFTWYFYISLNLYFF